ncbi:hypothetical protein GCM10007415_29000 [Parapedobacter pyrenivorans]|uniref:Uncharacterized protein n=1 Tax=Parapedobacter pyrenivorans TaxID=1305674 RepID=A0A917HWJ5_9SPHI|nr:hypothetical protein [Parapedobacter pyrenivorans]GGG92423.1 hypothetical protein GCM10007415_29000 [Parapedobacter pyrenivorans]
MKTRVISLSFLLMLICSAAWSQINYDDEFPKYYLETEDTFERLKELPRDTIRDTIFVSRFDPFFKQMLGDTVSLSSLLQQFDYYNALMDSLGKIDDITAQVYYNYLLPFDSIHRLSPEFAMREVYLDETGTANRLSYRCPNEGGQCTPEFLLRIDEQDADYHFVRDTIRMKRAISALFSSMAAYDSVKRIHLFFPDYRFQDKRQFVQFVKTVRLTMDASKDFKFGQTELNVIIVKQDSTASHEDLLYALSIEGSSLTLLEKNNATDDFVLLGKRLIRADMTPGFFDQLKSHYYIARYYPGSWDAMTANMTSFSVADVSKLLWVDYQENYWEIYFYIFIGVLVALVTVSIFYFFNVSFSMFVNNNMESVLLICTVLLLEVLALVINMFQYMCVEDTFTLFAKNPVLIFAFPLIVVLVVPMLRALAVKRRIP